MIDQPTADFLSDLGPIVLGLGGMIVAYLTAKASIRASTVSASRQRFLDSLRDDLSRLINLHRKVSPALPRQDQAEAIRAAEEIGWLNNRLELLLDRNDKDHATLLDPDQA